MSPKDENILSVVNLLALLFCARKQQLPKLPEEDQYLLTVTKEHLKGANLSIPVFVNTLKTLHERGYLTAVSIFEDGYHEKIREVFKDENYNLLLEQLSVHKNNVLTIEQKKIFVDTLEKMAPPNLRIGNGAFLEEKITFTDLLNDSKRILNNHKDDDVSLVVLMPFRDIEKLLEKMNNGKSFDEIQDSRIWYDNTKYEFHIGNTVILVSYQGKPNIEHYVLARIYECTDESVVWYDDISDYTPRALKDALLKFLKKNKKLVNLFTVHADRLVFDKDSFV